MTNETNVYYRIYAGVIHEQFTVKAHPAFFKGEGRGKKFEEHFSKLTKQNYFTAKVMLKYCSGEY